MPIKPVLLQKCRTPFYRLYPRGFSAARSTNTPRQVEHLQVIPALFHRREPRGKRMNTAVRRTKQSSQDTGRMIHVTSSRKLSGKRPAWNVHMHVTRRSWVGVGVGTPGHGTGILLHCATPSHFHVRWREFQGQSDSHHFLCSGKMVMCRCDGGRSGVDIPCLRSGV